jgi:3-phenylpropionate/trans-cinnamate dioxygenase ferredoxin subunit
VDYVRVGSMAEIPEGELRAYELAAGHVAVAHVENRVYAFADECTHEGCALSEGSLWESEDAVECPCHGSVFDLGSGEPIEGPAVDPIATYPARVEDGWVEVGQPAGGEE